MDFPGFSSCPLDGLTEFQWNFILLVLYWFRVDTNFRNAIKNILTQEKHTQLSLFIGRVGYFWIKY